MRRPGSVAAGRRFRGTAALTLALHSAILAFAPLADAALESRAPRVAHLESESDKSTCLAHEHLTCQLCRVITLVRVPSARAASPEPVARLASRGEGRTSTPKQVASPRSHQPRAPPVS